MNLIYDRTVTLARSTDTVGATGMRQQTYANVMTFIGASIQMKKRGDANYAGDDTPKATWLVLIDPLTSAGVTFTKNDRLTDDNGKQYRVDVAYPNWLGYELMCSDWVAHGRA